MYGKVDFVSELKMVFLKSFEVSREISILNDYSTEVRE